MAFVDAIFDGSVTLAGKMAKLATQTSALGYMLACGKAIPVTTAGFSDVLAAVRPDVLIDARMRKRSTPERQLDLAPVTVGLGPNFTAGLTTHLVVETAWGERLGRVIEEGESIPLSGEPRDLGGFARERFVYAAAGGAFVTKCRIGDWVEGGAPIASVAGVEVRAPISGFLRGLTRSGVEVLAGAKVVEIDPRREGAVLFGIGERPRLIAEGVLAALAQANASKST